MRFDIVLKRLENGLFSMAPDHEAMNNSIQKDEGQEDVEMRHSDDNQDPAENS